MIVPDDQLSLAIGREGQNARLAAKLTGWRVDIVGESEFAEQATDEGFEDEEEVADGRCAAISAAGRRCPNASLGGSRYCGLPQHQALARFGTNSVTILGPLSEADVQVLAKSDSPDGEVEAIVARAQAEFDESAGADEAAAEETEAPDEEQPEPESAPDDEPEATEQGEEEQMPEEEPAIEEIATETDPPEEGEPEGDQDAAVEPLSDERTGDPVDTERAVDPLVPEGAEEQS